MRITEVEVTNLFGVFDHTIPLNINERITIIYGPNGFGKTILLSMIHGLFNRRYALLRKIPFDKLSIQFDDDGTLEVTKKVTKEDELKELLGFEEIGRIRRTIIEVPEIILSYSSPRVKKLKPYVIRYEMHGKGPSFSQYLSYITRYVERELPQLERVGHRKWMHRPTREILTLEDIIDRFSHLLPPGLSKEPEWWKEVRDSIDVSFIHAERLVSIPPIGETEESESTFVLMVDKYSRELADRIQQQLAQSTALSSALDRSFPKRLVEHMGKTRMSEEQLRNRLGELEEHRSWLQEAGLFDKGEEIDFLTMDIDDNTKNVLAVYVEDIGKKLSALDEIAEQIELFKDLINEKFRYKQIDVSKEEGIIFTTFDGKPLPVTALSSGEQHELVLLYQLLFEVPPNSLILIDEPELSLHVAWQKQFLRDLMKLAELSKFDAIIATHSPQIISGHWDLARELKGPSNL